MSFAAMAKRPLLFSYLTFIAELKAGYKGWGENRTSSFDDDDISAAVVGLSSNVIRFNFSLNRATFSNGNADLSPLFKSSEKICWA